MWSTAACVVACRRISFSGWGTAGRLAFQAGALARARWSQEARESGNFLEAKTGAQMTLFLSEASFSHGIDNRLSVLVELKQASKSHLLSTAHAVF